MQLRAAGEAAGRGRLSDEPIRSRLMLAANALLDLLYRIMPPQYWYYLVLGLAVVAAAVGVWVWLKKGGGD